MCVASPVTEAAVARQYIVWINPRSATDSTFHPRLLPGAGEGGFSPIINIGLSVTDTDDFPQRPLHLREPGTEGGDFGVLFADAAFQPNDLRRCGRSFRNAHHISPCARARRTLAVSGSKVRSAVFA